MRRHPRRLARRNRITALVVAVLAVLGMLWIDALPPSCAQHARDSWSHVER